MSLISCCYLISNVLLYVTNEVMVQGIYQEFETQTRLVDLTPETDEPVDKLVLVSTQFTIYY